MLPRFQVYRRYAGKEKNDENNIERVLHEMKEIKNRNANFKTAISLIINDKYYLFKGIVNGKILRQRQGHFGFGYDSIFQPNGHEKSFAEMTLEEKNKISHRAIAIKELVSLLKKIKN